MFENLLKSWNKIILNNLDSLLSEQGTLHLNITLIVILLSLVDKLLNHGSHLLCALNSRSDTLMSDQVSGQVSIEELVK